MAKPYINKLNKYRSYSYHHILFACDSSSTAESVAKLDNFSEFISGNRFRTFRGRDSDRPLKSRGGGDYVVLINGITDVDFFIESASWFSLLMPRSGSGIPSFAMGSEGELKIVEPQGARFFNVLDKTFDVLGSDPSGLIFMLKTFFVGITDKGKVELITNVKPFMFIPYDIITVFDHAGGTYTMRFMAAYNGAIKAPAISKNQQITVTGKGTIIAALDDLQMQLNKQVDKAVTRLKRQDIKGRPVRYVIEADAVFNEKDYLLDSTNSRATEQSGTPPQALLAFGPDEAVDQMIDKIMKKSKRAVREATGREKKEKVQNKSDTNNPEEKNKKKKIWKIYSIVDSTPTEYIARYHVRQFELEEQSDNDMFSGSPKGHSVELDYIFSGNNIDIIEFDMKMEMGLGFLQLLTNTSNSIPSTKDAAQPIRDGKPPRFLANSAIPATKTSRKPAKIPRTKSIITAQTNARSPTMNDAEDSDNMTGFQALLSRWSGYESIEAKLKIHGNPVFLGELSTFPSEVRDRLFKGSTTTESNNEEEYGPSPLLKFVVPFIENNKGIEEIKKALEKETDIPKEYIPQDMDDGLQQILGCDTTTFLV